MFVWMFLAFCDSFSTVRCLPGCTDWKTVRQTDLWNITVGSMKVADFQPVLLRLCPLQLVKAALTFLSASRPAAPIHSQSPQYHFTFWMQFSGRLADELRSLQPQLVVFILTSAFTLLQQLSLCLICWCKDIIALVCVLHVCYIYIYKRHACICLLHCFRLI